MSNLPNDIRKQLKNFISDMTDESIDLVANLTGEYIDEEKRKKLKKEAEVEVGAKIEEAMINAYQMGLRLEEEYKRKKPETSSLKEKFYSVTDASFKSLTPDIPRNMHAIDYLFQVCEELLRDFRFNWRYLKNTKYTECRQSLEELLCRLKKEGKIGKAWEVLNEFKGSKDFYLLLQATLQKVIRYYEFLRRNFQKIEKKQIDKYLEIYEELSGHFEKLISFIAALTRLLHMNADYKYETARKKGPSQNVRFIKQSGWEIFVSGYDRKIRNAIVHKTCNIDIIKETVEFIDRKKMTVLNFKEVQKETRELSALLLILPHALVSIFCVATLSMREMLDSIT